VEPRSVTVVLDAPRGCLPPFTVPIPYWNEVESVVAEVRERFGLDIVVLRVLAGERPMETPVTYLAELLSGHPTDLTPWPDAIGEDPLRLPYARPGGPAADLAWASTFVELVSPAVQVRTWNLSSIWRLPTSDGTVWLKHVPPFFAHEPTILALLAGRASVPRLIAGDRAACHSRGCPAATATTRRVSLDAMITAVDLQAAHQHSVDELLALGVPAGRRAVRASSHGRDRAPRGDVDARPARRAPGALCRTRHVRPRRRSRAR
jgi:hypothetical protein